MYRERLATPAFLRTMASSPANTDSSFVSLANHVDRKLIINTKSDINKQITVINAGARGHYSNKRRVSI